MKVTHYRTRMNDELQRLQTDRPSSNYEAWPAKSQPKHIGLIVESFTKHPYAIVDGGGHDRTDTSQFSVGCRRDTVMLLLNRFRLRVDQPKENPYFLVTVVNAIGPSGPLELLQVQTDACVCNQHIGLVYPLRGLMWHCLQALYPLQQCAPLGHYHSACGFTFCERCWASCGYLPCTFQPASISGLHLNAKMHHVNPIVKLVLRTSYAGNRFRLLSNLGRHVDGLGLHPFPDSVLTKYVFNQLEQTLHMVPTRHFDLLTDLQSATELNFLFITNRVEYQSVGPQTVPIPFVPVTTSSTCVLVDNNSLFHVTLRWQTFVATRGIVSQRHGIIYCRKSDYRLLLEDSRYHRR